MDPSFESRLSRYAEVTVKVGLNVQAGQRLMVVAPVEAAPFVRLVGEWAYRVGARLVDVQWNDDALKKARFDHAPRDSFEEYPTWRPDALLAGMRRGDAVLAVYATDPDLLAGQDPELIATAQRTEQRHFRPFMGELMRGRTNWSVISYPIPSWAAAVFPDAPSSDQVDRLWETILEVCRMNEEDPVSAWTTHVGELRQRAAWLDRHAFLELRYLVATDDGSARLGEVALVPHSSPISRADLLFSNSLFDENAACHLALGKAYRLSLTGGEAMSEEEFAGVGGNDSLVHVDFMVGSAFLDVEGVGEDGVAAAVMRGGEWAF